LKVLLICAGGMSTSILMKKLKTYAKEQEMDFDVIAKGLGDYVDVFTEYDVLLLGPQVSYKCNDIRNITQKPVAVIPQLDYALGKADNIFKLISEVMAQ